MTEEDLNQIRSVVSSEITASEQRASECSRDIQTEILRSIEVAARGCSSRIHRLEASDTDNSARIAALEERVLYLWTRRPLQ